MAWPWPDEWVEMLKTLFPQGYSANAIAIQINATYPDAKLSRNAVIGKMTRLSLCSPDEGERRRRANGKKMGKARMRQISHANVKPSRSPRLITPAAPPPPKPPIPTVHLSTITGTIITGPKPIPPRPLPQPDGASGPLIDIMAISSRNCCWPVERDPNADEWMFCGQTRDPKSGSGDRGYCTKHRRIAIGRAA
jgi:hypothetical protein